MSDLSFFFRKHFLTYWSIPIRRSLRWSPIYKLQGDRLLSRKRLSFFFTPIHCRNWQNWNRKPLKLSPFLTVVKYWYLFTTFEEEKTLFFVPHIISFTFRFTLVFLQVKLRIILFFNCLLLILVAEGTCFGLLFLLVFFFQTNFGLWWENHQISRMVELCNDMTYSFHDVTSSI